MQVATLSPPRPQAAVIDSNGDFVAEGFTGADGTYKTTAIPTGSYTVEFVGGGNYLPQSTTASRRTRLRIRCL
jgi:hypothetical protein